MGMKTIRFYSKVFNMKETNQTITKVVYSLTTFYISIYDASAKKEKDIIASVNFRRDKAKRNPYIY